MRRLPDGSVWDPATGTVYDTNPNHAQMARAAELHRRQRNPIPNRGQHIETVVQARLNDGNQQVLLQPGQRSLAVDPFGTGMSEESMDRDRAMQQSMGILPNMSDMSKKLLLTGLLVAAAAAAVWVNTKMSGKSSSK
jgi:hypothetical protein